MNRSLVVLLFLSFLTACNQKRIANPADYNSFLEDSGSIERALVYNNDEIEFWSKRLAIDTGSYVDMFELASQYMQRFKLTGDVSYLHKADSFLQRSASKLKGTEPDMYFSLSQNAITQHRFSDAWQHLMYADSLGANAFASRLMQFDAGMELGFYQLASSKLQQVKDKDCFDYLVRKAKLEDHHGNPENAIRLMEKALQKAESSGKSSLILWAKSNLADMYGHAGRIRESYQSYLDVLKIDSSYLYALKGIAWIAFSHDKNPAEAKRILNFILSQTNMPDLYLNLAEIAEWEGKVVLKEKYLSGFVAEIEKPAYGDMYNKYLITIYAEELKDFEKALLLAEKEVRSRPTPETYDWLAWVYFNKGDVIKAGELVNNYVKGKTFEPEAAMHMAFILEANGKRREAEKLFSTCRESSFEIGPVAAAKINKRNPFL